MKTIAVIDGKGGGVGSALIGRLKKEVPQAHVLALGTNALATSAMLRAGADDGATGENAVICNVRRAHVLLAPVGALAADGLLGEVTAPMAAAIGSCDAVKILLPSGRCGIRLAVGPAQNLQFYIGEAVRLLNEELERLCGA